MIVDGAKWIIVRNEHDLSDALTRSDEAVLALKKSFTDPDERCRQHCLGAARLMVQRGNPVALLISPSIDILQLRIPAVGRVVARWDNGDGTSSFCLPRSQQPFSVLSGSPMDRLVASAEETGSEILVVDARFDGGVVHIESCVSPARLVSCDDEFALDVNGLTALDEREACELYSAIFALESVPPYQSGLPFRYSRRFCDVVAHSVAHFASGQGVTVGKAWAFARRGSTMTVYTSSRRNCSQSWWFHVAAVARQKHGGGLWVFDPNLRLERGVTTDAHWQASLGKNLGHIHRTTADAYTLACEQATCDIQNPCFAEEDPGELSEDLIIARCMLGCVSRLEGAAPHDCPGWDIELPECS